MKRQNELEQELLAYVCVVNDIQTIVHLDDLNGNMQKNRTSKQRKLKYKDVRNVETA
jgi:hypothetical protein